MAETKETQKFWIGKGVLKVGKELIKNGDPVPTKGINKDAYDKLVKDGKIGEIKNIVKVNPVDNIKKENEDLKKKAK